MRPSATFISSNASRPAFATSWLSLTRHRSEPILAHAKFRVEPTPFELVEKLRSREPDITAIIVDTNAVDLPPRVHPNPDLQRQHAAIEDLRLGTRVDEDRYTEKLPIRIGRNVEVRNLVLGIQLEAELLLESSATSLSENW